MFTPLPLHTVCTFFFFLVNSGKLQKSPEPETVGDKLTGRVPLCRHSPNTTKLVVTQRNNFHFNHSPILVCTELVAIFPPSTAITARTTYGTSALVPAGSNRRRVCPLLRSVTGPEELTASSLTRSITETSHLLLSYTLPMTPRIYSSLRQFRRNVNRIGGVRATAKRNRFQKEKKHAT